MMLVNTYQYPSVTLVLRGVSATMMIDGLGVDGRPLVIRGIVRAADVASVWCISLVGIDLLR